MSWRVARSLEVLLAEINAAAPNRNKAADGSIGDAAHATRTSDHNPWVTAGGQGIVRARDFTHHPAGGLDCERLAAGLAELLKTGAHVACRSGAYVIWRGRIFSFDRRSEGWRPYTGSNPHTHHLHLSVALAPAGFDSTRPWGLMQKPKPPEKPRRARIILCNVHATSTPALVVPWLIAQATTRRADAVLLQECTPGHARVLRRVPGWTLIRLAGPAGEAILARRGRHHEASVKANASPGWLGKHTGRQHPGRVLPSALIGGWLRVVSIHFPPGWLHGPLDRRLAGQAYAKSLKAVSRTHLDNREALFYGGDYNAKPKEWAWGGAVRGGAWGATVGPDSIDHARAFRCKVRKWKRIGRGPGMDHAAWLYVVESL